MMKNKTITTSVIAAIAITSIALVFGLSQTQNIAADTPQGNSVYVFAEGVNPQITFGFRDGTEVSDFQAFTQTNALSGANGIATQPEFTLVKVPGNTPLLYKAADELLVKGKRGSIEWQYNRFDAKVDLVQAGEPVRSFKYTGCEVTSYRVYTDWDKEEGYTTGGKTGFAVQDEFKLLCQGFFPLNPQLDQMNDVTSEYKTKSTLDLKQENN
ncbi:hypothetical protein [Candidatus Nitrosotenuis sp. DW1]|uniref:hypothetical protein n=1 Tax=Candidatus Nitrosotenuis sp. DW1 TaxID=2259672 RepID=UPI0015CC4C55|nr:hypothetical protein [Candidatus Nitrosotenuis sp. DW1]